MQSFVKIKPSRIGDITLLFTDIGKSCSVQDFYTSQMCLLTLFAKIKFSRKFPNLQYMGHIEQIEPRSASLLAKEPPPQPNNSSNSSKIMHYDNQEWCMYCEQGCIYCEHLEYGLKLANNVKQCFIRCTNY